MEAFHHHRPTHHHHHEPRRPWSGLSRKASSNGVAEEKTSSRVLNYAEIFAGFSSSCSIPVLDLPPAPEEPAPCGPSIDYSGIFGGFDPGDFGIPYEELVASEKAGNGAPSGSSKETGLFFPVDFLLEPVINESNRDNNKVVGKKQFSSNGDSQHASSVFEAENQSNKVVKSGTVHENKFHSVSGNSYLPVGNAAEGETGNTVACSSATDYVATNSVPLRSYNNIKGSEDGVVVSQEENRQLYNSPEAVQINEQYHSCSSSVSVSEDNSIPDISNNDQKKQNVVDASSSEVNSFTSSKSEFLTNTINPTNDSRAVGRGSDSNTFSSEGVYSSEVMFASSSINFSLGAGSFQNQSVDGCSKIPNSKGGMVDKLTPSTSYVLEKVIGGQSGAFTASENILAYDQEYVNSSKSTTLFPERSNDPTPFLKVSDINLRTEPCQVPPPSRPPPKLSGNQVFPKVMMAKSKSNVRCDAVTKPHNEAAKRDDQSSFYVEMNAGSAAAASVAEAMEQAQARLRSAKELMQRKKDTFHSRKKSTVDEMVKLETKVDGVTLVDGGKCHTEEMVFAGRESSKATAGQKVAADEGVVHEAMGRKKDSFHNRKKSSNETTKLETNVELPKMVDEIIEETYIFVTSGMCHTEKPFLSDHRPETIEVQKVVAYNCDLGNEVQGKKNSFHSRNNSLVEKTKLETKVEGPIIVDEIFEKINISDISGKCHDEKKVFTSGDGSIAAEAQKIAADHPLFPQKESTTSQLQISPSDKPDVGQWKVGEQFFEFVNNDKSFKKSPDASNSEPCKSVGNASVVITETDNSDNEKAKLPVMQEENNDYFVDSASELDTNDGTNARTVRYDGFSSDFEVLNVYTSTFEKLKVAATSSEVETLKVATEDVSDVSLHGNDEKLCNLFDSLQKQCGQDNENAKEQQFRNSEVYNHEDSHEVEESFDTFKCKVRSVEDCNVKIAEVPLQSSQFGEMHNATPEMDCKGNDNILNVPPYMDFELPEISKELEKPTCSYKDSNKEEYLEEFRETSSEACLCEEVTISEKGEAVDEKDDKKTSVDTLEAYELVDENKPNVADISSLHCTMGQRISDLTDNEKHGGVEEFVLWSDSEQEKQTKEPCWQYFCEKIIGKAETVFHEGDGSQIGTGLNQQMHEVNLQDGVERSHGTKVNKTSKCSEPSVTFDGKPYWNSQGGDTLKASEQASCGVDNMEAPDAAKQSTPKEFIVHAVKTEEKDTGSPAAKEEGMNIPETSKNAEPLEDLRNKRESELEKERMRKLEEEKEREREREKDRQAVEGAIHGSRERAFAEARERAERAAVERVTAEARQRALAEAREKAEKASNEALLLAEKASREAKLRAERAAVERATAEVRERAVERALAEKAAQEAKERTERSGWQWKENGTDYAKDNIGTRKNTDFFDYRDTRESQKYSNSSNHVLRSSDRLGGSEGESAMRSKARLERHQRTVERAAKALAEKNLRDTLAQREQAERNRLAETLDAEVKRWSSGKEGNLRALLSTLQYILGPESGWQPIPLTEVITAAAVKKAYRKATLYVHPDKLQQRGANIQQKYVCEKVFDLLKEAWNRFNSEER